MAGIGNLFKGKQHHLDANKTKHQESGGYNVSDAYKKDKEELKKKEGTLTPEQYAKEKEALQAKHAAEGGYHKSAAYKREKEEINGNTYGMEKIGTSWKTNLTLGAAPLLLMGAPMLMGGDKEQKPEEAPPPYEAPPAYSQTDPNAPPPYTPGGYSATY